MEDGVWESMEVIMELICGSLVVVLLSASFFKAYILPCMERLF